MTPDRITNLRSALATALDLIEDLAADLAQTVGERRSAHAQGREEGRGALVDALLSELDASRPDFALICQGIGRADGLGLAEVAMLRHGWQALADHLRAWLESGAPERPLLNEAWARINALGGRDRGDSAASIAFTEGINRALQEIESLGGHDPAERR